MPLSQAFLRKKDTKTPIAKLYHLNRKAVWMLILVIGATTAGVASWYIHLKPRKADDAPSGILATAPAAAPRRLNADGAPMSD